MTDGNGHGAVVEPMIAAGPGGRRTVHVLELLGFALANYRDETTVLALKNILHAAVSSPKKKPYGFITFRAPHEIVQSLKPGGRPYTMVLVSIPPEVVERMGSGIVLPGEVR